MAFETLIAFRQLGAKRSRSLSIVSWLAITGVALGVAALVGGFSITSGFEKAFQEKVIAFTSHVMVRQYGHRLTDYQDVAKRIEAVDGVLATSPMTHDGALFSGPAGSVGAVVKGVVPNRVVHVLDLATYIDPAPLQSLDKPSPDGVEGVILGSEFARRLGVAPGDVITILSPLKTEGGADWRGKGGGPASRAFRVAGIFTAGFQEYDSRLAFMRLDVAQDFFGRGKAITGIEVRTEDPMNAGAVAAQIADVLGRDAFSVYDWRRQNRNLFASLTYQRIAILVVLSVMVVLAACNVACLLIMLVLERTRDIAILKAMGATRRSIIGIVLLHGLVLGVLGTAIGMLLAFGLSEGVLGNGIELDPSVYGVDHFPVVFNVYDYVMAGVCAVTITLCAALLPAYRGARLNPVDGVRDGH
jgi:lipoprotein-releasing system permease protein